MKVLLVFCVLKLVTIRCSEAIINEETKNCLVSFSFCIDAFIAMNETFVSSKIIASGILKLLVALQPYNIQFSLF